MTVAAQCSCVRLLAACLQEWGDAEFDMPMQVGSRTFRTACTIAAFVSCELAESAGMPPGKSHLLQKQPGASREDSTMMAVYGHPAVAEGHVCLATDAMRQAGLMPHSQVWLARPLLVRMLSCVQRAHTCDPVHSS